MTKEAYIFDLDGTLCDASERYKTYIEDEQENWEEFYAHCDEDMPIIPVCDVLTALANRGYDILFVTGRRESCRETTLKWIREWFGEKVANTNHLFMRNAEDGFRSDYVSKMRNYRQHIQNKWHVLGVFEDRDQCVRAWRDVGLQCFQVADGCY